MLSKPVYTTAGEGESCKENLRYFPQSLNISDMTTQHQILNVEGPDGEKYLIHLQDFVDREQNLNRVTIGRDNSNDIVLPDPQRNISRRHFTLETEGIYWWVIDGVDKMVSANGTFVRQGDNVIDVRNVDRLRLKHGDVISILAKVVEPDQYLFWKLTYHDDNRTTNQIEHHHRSEPIESTYIKYSLSEEKLFRVNNQQQEEIRLRPQERCLIHFMATRNHSNNQQPVVCTYEELIEAIWGKDTYGRTQADINRLVFGLRHKLELDSGEPDFLQTVRKRGYRLQVKVLN